MIDSTLKNAKILIVDDQQANLDVLTGLLTAKGFTDYSTTTDARQVIKLFDKLKPDLLLLDLMMPHFNGYEVMKQLKSLIPANTYFPILILTADITAESKQKALSSGASDFLAKPFDLIEVDLRINNLLKVRYYYQQLENQNEILDEAGKFAENLINTIREPLIALDKELRVVKANHSFYDFFKVNPDETIGELIYNLGNGQWNIPKLRELLEKILPEKTTFDNYEVEHDFTTIGKRIMLLSAKQIERAPGKEKIILLTIEDITQKKFTEESFWETSRTNDEYLDNLFEHAQVPIIVLDDSSIIKRINSAFEKMSGYGENELRDKEIDFLFPKNKIDSTLELIKKTQSNEKPEIIEIDILTKDKKIRRVLWNSANIFNKEGKNIVASIAYEVSKRKRAEILLEESETRYRQLYEAITDGILITDAETKNFKYANPAMCRMLGYTENELKAMSLGDIHLKEDFQKVSAEFEKLSSGDDTIIPDILCLRKDGNIFYADIHPTQIIFDGRPYLMALFRDITERKQYEELLKKQRDDFETIFNLVPAQIWYKDTHNNFIHVNRQACTDIGMTQDEIEGYSAEEIFPSFAQQYFKDDLEVFNARKAKLGIIEQVNTADGEIRWVHSDKIPVFGKDGEVNGLIVVDKDITEQKRAEEGLRNSEARLQTLVHTIPDLIWLKDTTGVYLSCNKMFERFFGASESDIVGKTDYDFIDRELGDSFRKNDRRAMAAGKPTINEELIAFADDKHLAFLETIKTPMYDTQGIIIGVLGIGRDITERKHAEENLRESKNRYKELTMQLPQTVFEADLNGVITFANDFASETFGYSQEEILNKMHYEMIFIPEERNRLVENSRLIFNGYEQIGMEYIAIRKDGTIFPSLVYVNEIMRDEKPIGLRGVLIDISEIKKVEKELIEAKEKAELANKLKDAFIANISHEIRTPLNGILGMTSLIRDIFHDNIKEEDEELFDGIDISSKRIIRTVDMILNYSRMQVGEFKIRPKDMELSRICENLMKEFTVTAKLKSIQLTFQNKCTDAVIFADEYTITMAISNLIDNAIKYTKKGFVTIILDKLNNDDIILEIKDTGIGISKEYLNKLFEPYQQEHMGYVRAYEGIGLGLALVNKILILNNAALFVESKKGEGSEFSINFGKKEHQGKKITETNIISNVPVAPEKMGTEVVLLVEDDTINQITIKRFLGDNYKTIITDSSYDALKVLKKEKIDIILMDISIRGKKNGLELTKEIKASKDFSHIPVIAVTAHAFEKDKQNALEAGCDSFLVKPFTKESLLDLIGQYVRK